MTTSTDALAAVIRTWAERQHVGRHRGEHRDTPTSYTGRHRRKDTP